MLQANEHCLHVFDARELYGVFVCQLVILGLSFVSVSTSLGCLLSRLIALACNPRGVLNECLNPDGIVMRLTWTKRLVLKGDDSIFNGCIWREGRRILDIKKLHFRLQLELRNRDSSQLGDLIVNLNDE